MTIEISDGVTVTVNVPNRMPTICPATTPVGPITAPVQGGLTAEQLAHIVSVVTAKVVEELGGQPGGGGPGIDDATIGTDTTWSSQKTSDELAGKASYNAVVMDPETGEPVEVGPLNDLVVSLATQLSMAATWVDNENYFPIYGETPIVSELPAGPTPNMIYVVRAPDGVCTLHLPILEAPPTPPGG